jgi:hypothetical protein
LETGDSSLGDDIRVLGSLPAKPLHPEEMMETPNLIPGGPKDRLKEVLDVSWRILISRFIGGCHEMATEAPFQHHFANILRAVGQLYCTDRRDLFLVDLERKQEGIRGRRKYIDIVCGYADTDTSCAIELKFKTAQQGAQDHGRIDAYVDIETLEHACGAGHAFGRLYMITDSATYVRRSTRGVGTVFAMHHEHQTQPRRVSLPEQRAGTRAGDSAGVLPLRLEVPWSVAVPLGSRGSG